jgi:hypothetical protein
VQKPESTEASSVGFIFFLVRFLFREFLRHAHG